jgi:hypothetical protein
MSVLLGCEEFYKGFIFRGCVVKKEQSAKADCSLTKEMWVVSKKLKQL